MCVRVHCLWVCACIYTCVYVYEWACHGRVPSGRLWFNMHTLHFCCVNSLGPLSRCFPATPPPPWPQSSPEQTAELLLQSLSQFDFSNNKILSKQLWQGASGKSKRSRKEYAWQWEREKKEKKLTSSPSTLSSLNFPQDTDWPKLPIGNLIGDDSHADRGKLRCVQC